MEICSVDLRLLCRDATGQQQTSKTNRMNAAHMYSTCAYLRAFCVCASVSGCAFVSVSICMYLDGEMERRERRGKRDGDGADGRGEISERGLRHVKPSSHT